MKIPFTKFVFDKKEEKAIIDCMRSKWIVLGPKTQEFEEKFAEYVGAKYAVFVDSGTAALFLAMQTGQYSSYVNIPSLTFVSDAEVAHHSGLKIKFVDIDRDTLCVDSQESNLLPVNFAGVRAKGIGPVVDSCHRIEKDDVKDSASLWCYSFYATKNMTTGQGGMIALNNKATYDWLLKARDHGITKGTKQRYEGKDPHYDILFPGWRVKGDDLRASIGLVQLEKLPWMTECRNKIVARYNKNLSRNNQGNHLYTILVNKREEFMKKLFDKDIQTSIHFLPLHTMTAYKQTVALDITNYVGHRIVSLPLFPQMTDDEVDYVSEAVLKTGLMV